jgi:hypothetical protein
MKFTTKSTINKKYIRVKDLIEDDYAGPGVELGINVSQKWIVKPNTGTGKVDIETSDGKADYQKYLTALFVEDGQCIEVDDKPSVASPTYCASTVEEEAAKGE